MGDLLGLALYNPAILSDAAFLASFVARGELVERMLGRLAEIGADGLASHHLILGQRGMGKTSLLRRLAIGVRDDPALSAVLLLLSFREEQYNVHNLHVFWCNCLDALGDWYERAGHPEQAGALDRDLALLTGGKPDPEGDEALGVFRRWVRQEGRRPLLLLDNLDIILTGLSRQQWSLRRVLQQAGGVVVVGASAGYLEATADREAAFYDFFQVTVLERLDQDELLTCLHRLATTRGSQGAKVRTLLDTDPGRIRALHDLTGGNPRTLTLLYLQLETDVEGDALGDLERLLDQVTVLYKARVEDLAPQARVVLDAVALAWNPIIAADLAVATGLPTTTVSTQLDRLQKDGVVEKVGVSTSSRAAFQVSERFFNIWYLMRHGPRRQRRRLRWLTGFLRAFYTPVQLPNRATDLLKVEHLHGVEEAVDAYRQAVAIAPEDLVAQRNLLAARLIQPGYRGDQDVNFEMMMARRPGPEADLLRAIRAIVQDNFGAAVECFVSAITGDDTEVLAVYQGYVLLFLRQTAHRGYGDRLLSALTERGLADTHWPLQAAFDAYLHGEARLMDVNPEVRGAARRIYDWLDAPRQQAGKAQ